MHVRIQSLQALWGSVATAETCHPDLHNTTLRLCFVLQQIIDVLLNAISILLFVADEAVSCRLAEAFIQMLMQLNLLVAEQDAHGRHQSGCQASPWRHPSWRYDMLTCSLKPA